ncbi:PAN domain-containing protein [uncultured Algimonas sp.]|uniref:PAN domain-containing protein n=1 Tax=uncultured Algimonas sp. TaxID=1547920 RepID=UPI00261C907A|nr:PAN domain-containing protein [uncultured Algimonas sp.]
MRLSLFSLSAVLIAAPALSQTLAADPGTYRPGTPYHAVIVPGADVCASQCDGDARCRGWNYVKPSPTANGVCDLQAEIGAPIASDVSISGVSVSAPPFSVNVTSGGTNTIRVGTAVTSNPETRPVHQGGRVVRREAVPAPLSARSLSPHPGLRPQLDAFAAGSGLHSPGRAVSNPRRGVAPPTGQPMPRKPASAPVTWQSSASLNLHGRPQEDIGGSRSVQGYARPSQPVMQSELSEVQPR